MNREIAPTSKKLVTSIGTSISLPRQAEIVPTLAVASCENKLGDTKMTNDGGSLALKRHPQVLRITESHNGRSWYKRDRVVNRVTIADNFYASVALQINGADFNLDAYRTRALND